MTDRNVPPAAASSPRTCAECGAEEGDGTPGCSYLDTSPRQPVHAYPKEGWEEPEIVPDNAPRKACDSCRATGNTSGVLGDPDGSSCPVCDGVGAVPSAGTGGVPSSGRGADETDEAPEGFPNPGAGFSAGLRRSPPPAAESSFLPATPLPEPPPKKGGPGSLPSAT